MLHNIIFLGGIHGSGKTTIGRLLAKRLDIEYISASKLIRWEEMITNKLEKRIQNINESQNLLLNALNKTVKHDKIYILDGHYCLINKSNEIISIPFEIFKEINPLCLILIDIPFKTIENRLIERNYDYEFINIVEKQAKEEYAYAYTLSKRLDIDLIVSDSNTNPNIEDYLSNKISSIKK